MMKIENNITANSQYVIVKLKLLNRELKQCRKERR